VHEVKLLSPSLMMFGGMLIISALGIDYMSTRGFWTYISVQGAGFAVAVIAAGLSFSAFRHKGAWALFFASCCGWMVCWSWFLTLGLLIPVPMVLWAAISSVGFLISTFLGVIRSDVVAVAIAAAFGLGSALSTGILAANPVFASDYSYIPFAVGAVGGGVILAIGPRLRRRRFVPQRDV